MKYVQQWWRQITTTVQSNNTNITALKRQKGRGEREKEGEEKERVKEEMITNYNTTHTNLMIHITY